MSSLALVWQKEFDSLVKAAYQSKGNLLKSTVRNKNNIIGNSIDFRKSNYVIANKQGFSQVVQYQDAGYDKVVCLLDKYNCAVQIDDIERFTVNFDERQDEAMLLGNAIGRRSDQLIIDALAASATSNVIVNGGTGLTYAKIRQVNKFFSSLAIPPQDRHICISAEGESKLMDEVKFTSTDFIALNLIKSGTLDGSFAMGMNWHIIPYMPEGGLPKSGNIRDCFAYHKLSMGYSERSFSTQVERVATYDSDQALAKIFAGSIAVDKVGIVKIQIDETDV